MSAPPLSNSVVLAEDDAKALLLSCLDYRFQERIGRFLWDLGYRNSYDSFILAGASLGLSPDVNPKIASWQPAWWDHLHIAVSLHHIEKVIIVDHENCAAYKEFVGFDNEAEDASMPNIIPDLELRVHSHFLGRAYDAIKAVYPHLEVELWMIGLGDNVVRVWPAGQTGPVNGG